MENRKFSISEKKLELEELQLDKQIIEQRQKKKVED